MIGINAALEELYLPNRPGLSRRTIKRYQEECRHFAALTSDPPLDLITTATFNGYRAACLKSGLRPKSIECRVQTVLQVLRLCGPEQERRQGLGLIPKVPFVGVPLRTGTALKRTPTVAELQSLARQFYRATWPRTAEVSPKLFWTAWLGTLFVTGIRFRDFLLASRKQLAGDVLIVTAAKTEIAHVFPLPDWLMSPLYRLPSYRGRLFPCPLRPTEFRGRLKTLATAAGVPWLTAQAIRRASITEWSALNADCGSIIHGQGLGIRRHYVDPLRLLRKHLPELPNPLATD
jgi:hypothetical protein